MSEVVCSEELPAQWQKYPLKTQLEMNNGRRSIGMGEYKRLRVGQWADEGEKWLYENLPREDIEYHTSWDCNAMTITLQVCRRVYDAPPGARQVEVIFQVTEPAASFVSNLTVTKIIMVT